MLGPPAPLRPGSHDHHHTVARGGESQRPTQVFGGKTVLDGIDLAIAEGSLIQSPR